MHALVFGKARMAARTLLVRASGVWMWPGIPLTERRGAACVPVAPDVARFWITRLHGPQANDSPVLRFLGAAARKLSDGDEAGAQQALDASGLTRLSSDGAVLMRAVAGSLGIGPLDMPWVDGPWRAEDIAAHLPLFKDYAAAAHALAKAGEWDESKHPRVPAGSSEGGRFTTGGGGAGDEQRPTTTKPGGAEEGRRKYHMSRRLANIYAMPLRSWRQGGSRELWRALNLDPPASLWSPWRQRRKRPRGFTINILLSKPISMSQSRSKNYKIM
jgi:hypothetical protein